MQYLLTPYRERLAELAPAWSELLFHEAAQVYLEAIKNKRDQYVAFPVAWDDETGTFQCVVAYPGWRAEVRPDDGRITLLPNIFQPRLDGTVGCLYYEELAFDWAASLNLGRNDRRCEELLHKAPAT